MDNEDYFCLFKDTPRESATRPNQLSTSMQKVYPKKEFQQQSIMMNDQNAYMDQILSALNDEEPQKLNQSSQSYQKIQGIVDSMKFSKNQDYLSEINELMYNRPSQHLNDIDRDINHTIQDLQDIQTTLTYQKQSEIIKSVKKIVKQQVDRYFQQLKQQFDFIAKQSISTFQNTIQDQLFELKSSLNPLTEESSTEEQLNRLRQIKEEIANYKQSLPQDMQIVINNQALYDIKEVLRKLININFKESFKLIPCYFTTMKTTKQKKPQIVIKQKNGNHQQQGNEIIDHMFLYQGDKRNIIMIDAANPNKMIPISWQQTDLLMPVQCQLLHQGTSVYLLGQCRINLITNKLLANKQLFNFDITNNQISQLADMPVSTFCGQCCINNSQIYYWGGYVEIGENRLNARKGYKYDIKLNQWSELQSMKYPRIGGQCCTFDGKIYITGGLQNKHIVNSTIEIYDCSLEQFTDHFQLLNEMVYYNNIQSYTPIINGYSMVLQHNELLIFGGYSINGNSSGIQLLNTKYKTIQRSSSTFIKTNSYNCSQFIACNQSIYLFNDDGNTVQLIQLGMNDYQFVMMI